jgi:hypothetical protein
MQVSNSFKEVINTHLNKLAQSDLLFAQTLAKPSKNINDCVTYILNEVKKSGCNGFADDEIFNMAIHYYDEDKIEIGKPMSGKVVVNHSLPPDPKPSRPEASKVAKPEAVKTAPQPTVKAKATASKTNSNVFQPSLFD